jgi:hypothetical protein
VVKENWQDNRDFTTLGHMVVPDIENIPKQLGMGKRRYKTFMFKEKGEFDTGFRVSGWVFLHIFACVDDVGKVFVQLFVGIFGFVLLETL